jgi:RNA 2',3'-cyclic 3'-phosphodiesterase
MAGVTTTPSPVRDPARLFLALWPDAAGRAALLAWQRAVRWPPAARLTSAQNLHLTLHFIGAVPAARVPELAAGVARPCPAFELLLDRFEVWPRGVAVLQPATVPAPLTTLVDELADALKALALPVESRPFRPHATLARHATGATLADAPPPLRWPVHAGYVLAESAGGYRVLQRFGDT